MESSFPMQAYIQTPPVEFRLSAAQPTSRNGLPIKPPPYYRQKQINQQSNRLWNWHSFSPPVSNVSSTKSKCMPQMSSNFIGQVALLPAAQNAKTLDQNFNHLYSQTPLNKNTIPQQNLNLASIKNISSTAASWCPSNYEHANATINQINLTDQSVIHSNAQHSRMHIAQQTPAQLQLSNLSSQAQASQTIHSNQGRISGGHANAVSYSTISPATSQRLLIPFQQSNTSCQTGQSHSSHDGNQYSSQIQKQPLPYRIENNDDSHCHLTHKSLTSIRPSTSSYIDWHLVQNVNHSAESDLLQDSIQPQTPLQQCNPMQVSGHHPKPSLSTVPAVQGNTQSYVVQKNHSTTRPLMFSQIATPTKPNSEAPSSILTKSTVNQSGLLIDGTQVPIQSHGTSLLSCYKANFITHRQHPSHNSNKGCYSEKHKSTSYCNAPAILHGKEIQYDYPTPVQKTAILKGNVHNSQLKTQYVQSSEVLQNNLHTDTNPEKEKGHDCNNGHKVVQYSENMAEILEVIMALQKVHQQSHRVVAVPPISQQVPHLEKRENVTTQPDDSLPFKIDAVGSLIVDSENVEHCSNALNLPKETFMKLQKLFLERCPEIQDYKRSSESAINSLISEIQNTDILQSVLGSTTSEAAACSAVSASTSKDHTNVNTCHSNHSTVDLQQNLSSVKRAETQDSGQDFTSKGLEDQSIDEIIQSNSDTVDLPELQVRYFTLKNFIDLVKFLENKVKNTSVENVVKCILDLYYNGNISNIVKQVHELTAELSGLFSKVSIDDIKKAKFKFVHSNDLKKLAHSCHILKNDTILPFEEFRSSWLNVEGQPADIETVLAEPILEENFSGYASKSNLITLPLSVYFESEISTIPAAMDKDNVQMNNNEPASKLVSLQNFDMYKQSEKHKDMENMEEPKEQNGHLNYETVGTLAKNKGADGEQACRDKDTKEISASPEITEAHDLPNEDNSRSDSALLEITLLSSNDARTVSSELFGGNVKKGTELCQDKIKVLATTTLGEFNDFCSTNNQIKFTCPHMTIDCHGEYFCSRCWEVTPVLNLDKCLLSPENATSTQGHKDQSCSAISGSPDSNCVFLLKSNSKTVSENSISEASKITISQPDFGPIVMVESCTLQSGKLPVKEPCDNFRFTSALENQVSKTTNLMRLAPPEVPTSDSPPESRPHKKLRLSKSRIEPLKDDLVIACKVIKKASSKNSHAGSFCIAPAEHNQKRKNAKRKKGRDKKNSQIKQKPQINAKQIDTPETKINIVYSETRSDSTNPLTYGESSSAFSGTFTVEEPHRRVHSESPLNMAVKKQMCEANRLFVNEFPRALACACSTDKRKSDILSQTTRKQKKYSPSKKVKTISVPTSDDSLPPDITVKKACFTSSKDGRHPFSKEKKEEKKSPIDLLIQCHSSPSKTDDARKLKTLFFSKPTRHNKEKQRFALYGTKNVNTNKMVPAECSSKSKLSTAPLYVTVLNSSETAPIYTDRVSAKQKVYSQWCSTFVPTKTKTSSRTRHHKNVKGLMESRMKALRNCVNDRLTLKEKQIRNSSNEKC